MKTLRDTTGWPSGASCWPLSEAEQDSQDAAGSPPSRLLKKYASQG